MLLCTHSYTHESMSNVGDKSITFTYCLEKFFLCIIKKFALSLVNSFLMSFSLYLTRRKIELQKVALKKKLVYLFTLEKIKYIRRIKFA